MGAKEKKYLAKARIDYNKIMYITRGDRKTIFHMENGSKLETFHTMKDIMEELPDGMFESINKGIVISSKYVKSVSDKVYIMTDGTELTGRVRSSKDQKRNAKKYNGEIDFKKWSSFSILNNLPLPFCIIELVFDANGHGIDFIFRYCNKEMENLEGKTLNEMIDHSFYEIFENGDPKWLVTYADVALNGVSRIIESYSPEIDERLKIYCYQPRPNFCACLLNKL